MGGHVRKLGGDGMTDLATRPDAEAIASDDDACARPTTRRTLLPRRTSGRRAEPAPKNAAPLAVDRHPRRRRRRGSRRSIPRPHRPRNVRRRRLGRRADPRRGRGRHRAAPRRHHRSSSPATAAMPRSPAPTSAHRSTREPSPTPRSRPTRVERRRVVRLAVRCGRRARHRCRRLGAARGGARPCTSSRRTPRSASTRPARRTSSPRPSTARASTWRRSRPPSPQAFADGRDPASSRPRPRHPSRPKVRPTSPTRPSRS